MAESLEQVIAAGLGIGPDRVRDELAFQSVPEWDSNGHVSLMLELERVLDVEIDGDTMVELTSVGAIRAFVAGHRERSAE